MGLLSLEYFKLSEFFKILYPDVSAVCGPTTPNPVYVLMMYRLGNGRFSWKDHSLLSTSIYIWSKGETRGFRVRDLKNKAPVFRKRKLVWFFVQFWPILVHLTFSFLLFSFVFWIFFSIFNFFWKIEPPLSPLMTWEPTNLNRNLYLPDWPIPPPRRVPSSEERVVLLECI